MNLNEANHVITSVATMLDNLVEQGVIDIQVKRNLVPVLVESIIKNEAVTSEYIES